MILRLSNYLFNFMTFFNTKVFKFKELFNHVIGEYLFQLRTIVSISSRPSRILLLGSYFIAIFFSGSFLVSRILVFC